MKTVEILLFGLSSAAVGKQDHFGMPAAQVEAYMQLGPGGLEQADVAAGTFKLPGRDPLPLIACAVLFQAFNACSFVRL